MLCQKCHKEIPDGSIFCNWCGKKQGNDKKVTRRGNGLGTAYKRGNYWQAEFTIGYYKDENGKLKRRKRTKSGFKTKRDALDYITNLKANKKQNTVNFEFLWNSFECGTMQTLSKSKQTAYNIAWNKTKADLCYRTIDDVTTDELQYIVDKYGTSYYTKRDIKNLLSHLYKLAMRDDYVNQNKSTFILLPKLVTSERDIFSEKEIQKLWDDYTSTASIITAHLLIMIYTGMRPGEILSAKKENAHIDEHYLIGGIKTAKGRNRKIILPDKIIPIISSLINQSSRTTITTYSNENDFYDEWALKKEELNLNKSLVPYCCRHTYVTNCTKLHMSPAMLQELTGHEDYDTTLDYTHLSIADRLAEVNKL